MTRRCKAILNARRRELEKTNEKELHDSLELEEDLMRNSIIPRFSFNCISLYYFSPFFTFMELHKKYNSKEVLILQHLVRNITLFILFGQYI